MNNKMLGRAIELAAVSHHDQFDKGGHPYILHPLRLMMRLRTDDSELMCIAVLHDVIEDTNVNLLELEKLGFSSRIIDALRLLTHGNESYEKYIETISTNRDAIMVKLEDIKDNSDVARLKDISEKDFIRTAKYHKAYTFLKSKL